MTMIARGATEPNVSGCLPGCSSIERVGAALLAKALDLALNVRPMASVPPGLVKFPVKSPCIILWKGMHKSIARLEDLLQEWTIRSDANLSRVFKLYRKA